MAGHLWRRIMLQYVVRRLLLAIPILVAVVTLVFFVVRMAPGDPAQVILGDSASQESLDSLRSELGLDRPIMVQYGEFLFSVVRGDLGESIIRKQSINTIVAEVMPYTIELTVAGVLVGVVLGIPLGVFSAVFRFRPSIRVSCSFSPLPSILTGFPWSVIRTWTTGGKEYTC
jgi:ABC-type dipeptide/oligopeptide/nickel transport system permease component